MRKLLTLLVLFTFGACTTNPQSYNSDDFGADDSDSTPPKLPTTPPNEAPPVEDVDDTVRPGTPTRPVHPPAHGSGSFKGFKDSEVQKIQSHILSPKSENLAFVHFAEMVSAEMTTEDPPVLVNTYVRGFKDVPFDIFEKPFCESFSVRDLGIDTFFRGKASVKARWTGRNGEVRLREMARVNQHFNKIRAEALQARMGKSRAAVQAAKQKADTFWQLFMSCLAYGESGVFWNKKNTQAWRSRENDYGIFQFNPDQSGGGGNVVPCVVNWNRTHKPTIDYKQFRSSIAYRKSIITKLDQRFNTFCGANKINQNLAAQTSKGDACLNPFKKSYNHYGALMVNSDHNFLRCSSRMIGVNDASTKIDSTKREH